MITIALVVEVGRRVEFRVTKARVSFPRRESYGLEARFKVKQHLNMGHRGQVQGQPKTLFLLYSFGPVDID